MTGVERVRAVLDRRAAGTPVFAPNYWQWFTHHRNHRRLPPELRDCRTQLDMIRRLGLPVFSRNIYCDPERGWFGGLSHESAAGFEIVEQRAADGADTVTDRVYRSPAGELRERRRYVREESTLVQETFLLDGSGDGIELFERLVAARRWRFDAGAYAAVAREVGDDGLAVAGELFSPLKLMHLSAGAANAVYLLEDHPDRCRAIMAAHEDAQLDLLRQMLAARVPAVMAMDNLDAAFHPPEYLERCSASFYARASALCREAGSAFFIHACGQQRAILPRIGELGVDGLEGVAHPPLGDVELDDALRLTGDRLIVTGGITAMETERFRTSEDVRAYVRGLLARMRPFAHRFMLSAGCNTSIRTSWDVIRWFAEAWHAEAG